MNAAEAAAMMAGNEHQYAEAVGLIALVDPAELLIELIAALDDVSLSNQERERRLTAVYTRAALTSEQRERIANATPTIKNSVLKNALMQLLPPELKRRVIGTTARVETWAVPSSSKEPAEAAKVPVEPMGATGVVILSREPDQATLRRLGDAGFSRFGMRRWTNLATLCPRMTPMCAGSSLRPRFSTFSALRSKTSS